MDAKDAIRQVIEAGHMLARMYTDDFSDADLLVRSVPEANHIAWQLGHAIGGTRGILGMLGHDGPPLPEGFEAAHGRETSSSDDPAAFRSKEEYLALMDRMKAASMAAVDATPNETLDDPGPEAFRSFCPTVGSVLLLLGTHWLMHAGQFVPIRRKLGKPVMF